MDTERSVCRDHIYWLANPGKHGWCCIDCGRWFILSLFEEKIEEESYT